MTIAKEFRNLSKEFNVAALIYLEDKRGVARILHDIYTDLSKKFSDQHFPKVKDAHRKQLVENLVNTKLQKAETVIRNMNYEQYAELEAGIRAIIVRLTADAELGFEGIEIRIPPGEEGGSRVLRPEPSPTNPENSLNAALGLPTDEGSGPAVSLG